MDGYEATQQAFNSASTLMVGAPDPETARTSFFAGMMFGIEISNMDAEVTMAMLDMYYRAPHNFEAEELWKDAARAIIAAGRSA